MVNDPKNTGHKPAPVGTHEPSRERKSDAPARKAPPLPREVLFEFQKVGHILRVTAIDPDTGTEVIMVADPRQSQEHIKRLAARKLAYVLEKNRLKREKLEAGKAKGVNRLV